MSHVARAWAAWTAIGTVHVAALSLFLTQSSQPGMPGGGDIVILVMAPILYASLGLLMLVKERGRLMGWLFMAVPACVAIGFFAQEWALRAMLGDGLPGDRIAGALNEPFARLLTISLGLLVMLFPDGRFLNRFWRAIGMLALASGLTSMVITLLSDAPAVATFRQGITFARAGLGLIPDPDGSLAWMVGQPGVAAAMSGVVAVLFRFRRARGDVRLQLRWLTWALGTGFALLLISGLPIFPDNTNTYAGAILVLGIPAGAGIAVLKYRLYEIDLVISKTLVYGALAAFVTGLYVAIVAAVGLVAGRGDEPSLTASVFATAAVALLFQPVRDRLQAIANRVVFGQRATPYEVLARISRDLADAGTDEEVLGRMASTLAGGTGALRTAVWLRAGDGFRVAASWPVGSTGEQVADLTSIDADLTLPVAHDDETLGALSVVKAPDDRLTSTERKLAEHLASQAGLVMRNARLRADLRARLEELRASRQRLVKAQNEARRRIERNIHDGAQQEIVALKIKLGIAAQIAEAASVEQIKSLQDDVGEALEGLRTLARGIYPPLLASEGLEAALRSHASKRATDIMVDVSVSARYDEQIESTVYFCVLECLRNAQDGTVVRLEQGIEELSFRVTELSVPLEAQSATDLRDRLAALEGTLEEFADATAWVVHGVLPARALTQV